MCPETDANYNNKTNMKKICAAIQNYSHQLEL